MQHGQRTFRGDLENLATTGGPAANCCPIKASVVAQHQTGVRLRSIGAVRLGAKAVHRCQLARWADFEDGTVGSVCAGGDVGPAYAGCAVEVPVRALDKRPVCAGDAIEVATQNTNTAEALFSKLNFFIRSFLAALGRPDTDRRCNRDFILESSSRPGLGPGWLHLIRLEPQRRTSHGWESVSRCRILHN